MKQVRFESGDWLDEMDLIKLTIPDSFLGKVYYPETLEREYEENDFLVGFNRIDKQPVYMKNITAGVRILILGMTRTGKTWLSQRILSVAYKSGKYKICILSDIKEEFVNMNKPIQAKFRDLLPENEMPIKDLPIKVYRPLFFRKLLPNDKGYGIPCQIRLCDCTFADLATLMNITNDKSEKKRDMLMFLFDDIGKGKINTIEELIEAVKQLEMFTSAQQKSLIQKLKILDDYGVVGDSYPFDFGNDLCEGYIPILNMSQFDALGKNYTSFPQSYVSIALQQICRAKQQKKIKPKEQIIIFIDELARFCPKNANPASKDTILEAIDVQTGSGIHFVFCSQDLTKIPDSVLNQSRFVLIPYTADMELVETVFKKKRLWRYSPRFYNQLLEELSGMRKYEWILIDAFARQKRIAHLDFIAGKINYTPLENVSRFISYPPLFYHKETVGKS